MYKALTFNALCGVAFAIAMLTPLCSQASEPALSARVSYADLNLSNAADVHALYSRLSKAADEVCPNDSVKAHRGCVREAIDGAVRSARVAPLSALYSKITGVPVQAPAALVADIGR